MIPPLHIASLLNPSSLQTLLLLSLRPSLLVHLAQKALTYETAVLRSHKAGVIAASAALREMRQDPNATKNFVKISKHERQVIALTKSKDDMIAANAALTVKIGKALFPVEMLAYATLVFFYYNTHILTLTDDLDVTSPGSYYKSVVFPASFSLHTLPKITAMEAPGLVGRGGSVGVGAVIFVCRKCVGRVFEVASW